MSKIIVISPHPDDEAIGCGGAICYHIQQGHQVEVIFLTSGEKGGHGRPENQTIEIREAEAISAGKILGVANIDFWKQPDGAMKANDECVERLAEKIKLLQPEIIYVTHEGEMHPDHKAAAELVRKAVAEMENEKAKPVVWTYEVWTPIQQIDHIVDISAFVGTKRRAIQAHHSQCSVLKFDEAILGLNRYRGEMHSWPGGDYAEIFKKLDT